MEGSQSSENHAKHKQDHCSILPLLAINNQNEARHQH